jgi:hypothetical protein
MPAQSGFSAKSPQKGGFGGIQPIGAASLNIPRKKLVFPPLDPILDEDLHDAISVAS